LPRLGSSTRAPNDARAESARRSKRRHRIELPFARNTLERVFAPIVQGDSGACDEILDRSGNEHFVGLRKRCDSRTDVNGDPADLVVHELAFAGVKPYANLDRAARAMSGALRTGVEATGERA
jgi:hypothetical protein